MFGGLQKLLPGLRDVKELPAEAKLSRRQSELEVKGCSCLGPCNCSNLAQRRKREQPLNRQSRLAFTVPQRLIKNLRADAEKLATCRVHVEKAQQSAHQKPPKSYVHPRPGHTPKTSRSVLPVTCRHVEKPLVDIPATFTTSHPGDIPATYSFDEDEDDSPINLVDIDKRTNYRSLMNKFRTRAGQPQFELQHDESTSSFMTSTSSKFSLSRSTSTATSHRKWQIRIPPISRLPRSMQAARVKYGDDCRQSQMNSNSTPRLVESMGEYLNFENWNIDNTYLACLCQGHSEMFQAVQHVNVAHNRIGAQGFVDLFAVLQASNVQSINLEDNQCGEKSGLVIARAIDESGRRWTLTELNLSGNSLGDTAVEKLCEALTPCKQLAGLGLARNELGKMDISGKALGDFISTSISLSVLDLHWNYFRGAGGLALITGIYENGNDPNTKMTRLNLAWNRLGAPIKSGNDNFSELSAKMMASVFQCSKALFHLDLSYNGFASAECKILAEGLRTNHTLFGIHLNGNDCAIDDLGFITPHPESNFDIMTASHQRSTIDQYIEEIPKKLGVDFVVRNNMVSKALKQDAIIHRNSINQKLNRDMSNTSVTDSRELDHCMSTTSVTSISNLCQNSSFPTSVSANLDTEMKWVRERSKVQRPEQFGGKAIDALNRNARCCWICENWVAHEIEYVPGLSDETKTPEELEEIESIYAFFGIDGFTRPIRLTPLEEAYCKDRVQPATKKSKGRQPALNKDGKLIRWVGKRRLPPSVTQAEVIFQINGELKLSDDMQIKPLKEPVRVRLFTVCTEEEAHPVISVPEVNYVSVGRKALQSFLRGDDDPLVVLEDPKQRDNLLVVPRMTVIPVDTPKKPKIKQVWSFEISCWYGFKFFKDFDATFEGTRKGYAEIAADCFDFDVKCIKLDKFIKGASDLKELRNFVRPVYKDFIVSYRHILSQCAPLGRHAMGASLLEYTEWLAGLKEDFFDDDFIVLFSDTIFIAANLCEKEKKKEFFKVTPEKGLCRCQFFEALTRVCFKKYFQSGKCDSPAASMKELHGLMAPLAQEYLQERRNFQNELFTEECDIVFKQHLDMLKKIYEWYALKDFYNGRRGKALSFVSWTNMLYDANIEEVIPASAINDVWIISKEMMIDELASWRIMELNFQEFLVSLGAIIKFKADYEPVFFADLLDDFFNDHLMLAMQKMQGGPTVKSRGSDASADAGLPALMAMLRNLFQEMDADNSGCLTMEEFQVVMSRSEVVEDLKKLEINISDTGVLFKQLDSDGSGEMTIDELCDGLAKIQSAMKGVERALAFISRAFQDADADGSGVLSLEELQRMLGNSEVQRKLDSLGIDVGECEDIMGFVDADGSGEVSLDELTHGLLQMRDPFKAGNRALNLMKKLFYEADKDGSGTLTKTEMKKTFSDPRCIEKLAKLNLHFPDLDSLFDQLDEDASGDVNFDELSRAMVNYWKNAVVAASTQ
eukprot:gnl/MRDRNA2_/MRDRNA2_81299_c1_seq1.p1 gnl/MRDRNA2_/MRDRNA2_81299_c1~~gnl/MRDRNA2_/MRDRNA2_81299_c1_seq1.p1  ORF type:complete len:1465 (+),score=308.52 gnl/MRDRNA2_/MRDRNA2_81299_c1_seq1:52-4446(+)